MHVAVQSARMSPREAKCQAGARSEAVVVPGGLPRDAVVGVLGGGQLGKMLGTDAVRLGRKGAWMSDVRWSFAKRDLQAWF